MSPWAVWLPPSLGGGDKGKVLGQLEERAGGPEGVTPGAPGYLVSNEETGQGAPPAAKRRGLRDRPSPQHITAPRSLHPPHLEKREGARHAGRRGRLQIRILRGSGGPTSRLLSSRSGRSLHLEGPCPPRGGHSLSISGPGSPPHRRPLPTALPPGPGASAAPRPGLPGRLRGPQTARRSEPQVRRLRLHAVKELEGHTSEKGSDVHVIRSVRSLHLCLIGPSSGTCHGCRLPLLGNTFPDTMLDSARPHWPPCWRSPPPPTPTPLPGTALPRYLHSSVPHLLHVQASMSASRILFQTGHAHPALTFHHTLM
ncbi:PREDICTED: uncharacterized protein LOC109371483 isoform X2 [Hipposideros armiger]|uniref:Uncharacterized protein LOC109371483 isoform X2 n=1 Tax=Hipposideros armiger TaxID=186990 RepID=A0A8B7PT33_HIPAR|nr:PREDICTED: uncharacterized protein LOC109371483 isoform X2 [Hipposideros armiger]